MFGEERSYFRYVVVGLRWHHDGRLLDDVEARLKDPLISADPECEPAEGQRAVGGAVGQSQRRVHLQVPGDAIRVDQRQAVCLLTRQRVAQQQPLALQ